MKIRTNLSDTTWKIGDVIADEKNDSIALIVRDNDGKYCAMDIDGSVQDKTHAYTTAEVFMEGDIDKYDDLGAFQGVFARAGWRKVQAKLIVNANVKLTVDRWGETHKNYD